MSSAEFQLTTNQCFLVLIFFFFFFFFWGGEGCSTSLLPLPTPHPQNRVLTFYALLPNEIMWSSTYCFEVTVQQMFAELCPPKWCLTFHANFLLSRQLACSQTIFSGKYEEDINLSSVEVAQRVLWGKTKYYSSTTGAYD